MLNYRIVNDNKNRGVGTFTDVTGDGKANYILPYADGQMRLATFKVNKYKYFEPARISTLNYRLIKYSVNKPLGKFINFNE